jgi:hypothetical protein
MSAGVTFWSLLPLVSRSETGPAVSFRRRSSMFVCRLRRRGVQAAESERRRSQGSSRRCCPVQSCLRMVSMLSKREGFRRKTLEAWHMRF